MRASNQDHSALIRVSELTRYLRCPRLVYFAARGHEQPRFTAGRDHELPRITAGRDHELLRITAGREQAAIEHLLWKEVGFHLPQLLASLDVQETEDEPEMDSFVRTVADCLDGVAWIYRAELQSVEMAFFEEVKHSFVERFRETPWLTNLKAGGTVIELERAYSFDRERTLRSPRLGMVGSVDKLIRTEAELIPGMIKTGRSPEYGVWPSDRMQLAAYAMLIEEEFETIVQRGFVEYVRTADFREAGIKKRDRALAFQLLSRVKKVQAGFFPEKGANPPCDSCAFLERCETRKTILSKLLGR
jgi:CRISPR-associated exonuclease Cas4